MGPELRLVTLLHQLLLLMLLRVLLLLGALLCATAALATLQQVLQGRLRRQLWVMVLCWGVAVICGGGPSPPGSLRCPILCGLVLLLPLPPLLRQALLLLLQRLRQRCQAPEGPYMAAATTTGTSCQQLGGTGLACRLVRLHYARQGLPLLQQPPWVRMPVVFIEACSY